MESCSCIHCTGDDFHREQMLSSEFKMEYLGEFAGKDDHLEARPSSVYSQLQELHSKLNSTRQMNKLAEVLDRLNAIDTHLMEIALTCKDEETTEKILEVQYSLY